MSGRKDDQGKLRYDLVPFDALDEIVAVLTDGATKYGDWNWTTLGNATDRYAAALLRHISSHQQEELHDPETGRYHLAHAGCCILFLLHLLSKQQEEVQ